MSVVQRSEAHSAFCVLHSALTLKRASLDEELAKKRINLTKRDYLDARQSKTKRAYRRDFTRRKRPREALVL